MSVPNTSELDDDQIEALIRKLSAIKGSAPELIAALEAEANSRLKSKSARSGRSGGSGSRDRGRNTQRQDSNPRQSRSHSYEDEEEDDDDEYDDDYDDDEETDSEEDDDEFDEDGPCVGYGYSDEVSVISEMTTPTVVSNLHVPAEERYEEINQGYAKQKGGKPDLLSQVNRANAAKNKKGGPGGGAGGAAGAGLPSEKRKTYTSGLAAMAKISETAETAAVTKPKTSTPRATKKGPQRKASGDGGNARGKSGRGLRRDNSPARAGKPKKAGTGTKKSGTKKTRSGGAGSGDSNEHADAFGDDWHKSLSANDFNGGSGMDDNGFPISFGDTDNAFAASSNSFFKNKGKNGGGGGESADPFDPFSNGDPFKSSDAFDTKNNAFASPASGGGKKKPAGRPRRSSGMAAGSNRSKPRDQSPRRKGAR